MWYEYSIPANFEKQKEIIRKLRKWIQKIEHEGQIKGFAFDFYYNNPQRGNVLCIRFDYQNEENRKTEDELTKKVIEFVPDYVLKGNTWESPNEGELEAYEFGSRCAFLFWDLVERGRFKEDYISDFLPPRPESKTPFMFQLCFNHGVMNSLGIQSKPNEKMLHLELLNDCNEQEIPQLLHILLQLKSQIFS